MTTQNSVVGLEMLATLFYGITISFSYMLSDSNLLLI